MTAISLKSMVKEVNADEGSDRLIDFYGTECVHCKDMIPIMEKIEAEIKVEFVKIEVWHNAQNMALMEKYNKDEQGNPLCRSIPFFYNEKSGHS